METEYKFTRTQLIEAFRKWNKEFELKPEDFNDKYDAEKQADALIMYIYE